MNARDRDRELLFAVIHKLAEGMNPRRTQPPIE